MIYDFKNNPTKNFKASFKNLRLSKEGEIKGEFQFNMNSNQLLRFFLLMIMTLLYCINPKTSKHDSKNLEKENIKVIPLYPEEASTNFSRKEGLIGIYAINDRYEFFDVDFNNFLEISFTIEIFDQNGQVPEVPIRILVRNQEKDSIVYLSLTDQKGQAKGNILIPKKFSNLQLEIIFGDFVAQQSIILFLNEKTLVEINRKYSFNQNLKNLIKAQTDSDSDGIPDWIDSYPLDPKRSAKIQTFVESPLLIAVEDDVLQGGKIDFNDIVLQVSLEEDRDSFNNIVRFRGTFTLLAKGSKFSHLLYFNFLGKGIYHSKLLNSKAQIINEISYYSNYFNTLPLFLKSSKYFENPSYTYVYLTTEICENFCNVHTTNNKTTNFTLEIEIIFDESIHYTTSRFPFNLYLLNVDKNIEIPLFFSSEKEPKVLILPYGWNWPLEQSDIFSAYPYFENWLHSNGKLYKDWYNKQNLSFTFPYFTKNPISAYLLQINVQQSMIWTFLLIFITGIVVFLFIKGRSESFN